MKFRGPLFFSILALLLAVAAFYPKQPQDTTQKEAVLMQAILANLNHLHFLPKEIDNEFSAEVFDLYLDRIDNGRRFLTQKDVKELEAFRQNLDDEALSGSFVFFDRSLEILHAAQEKTQAYYRELLAQPFNYETSEHFEADGKKRGFADDDDELRDFWRQYLKFEVLQRLADKLEEQENQDEEIEAKSFEQLEQESRENVLEFMDGWFDRLSKLKRDDRMSIYLNTITSIFDPHSEYYKPIDKANFDIRFSGKLEGIGATLQSDGDFTKVHQIVVGGPAWKQKELEKNDLILKVRQESEEEAVNIAGMQLNDVVQLIRGKKGTSVILTVRKADGTTRNITIVRDVVILEEQFAKSLILEKEELNEKIGYIFLPSFYADFQDNNGRFCSKDVADEIEKLKAENVDGIILDLRSNGGGSLRDVVKMTGYFIESGPIVQVKSRDKPAEVLKDVDPRVQYDGPLVIMVNSYSASASEILAAALQDYGRAVIVGSGGSTFGKGTVQRFVDLDRTIRGYSDLKPLGEIKLTTQKFYRINGGSTQLKGVVPDIILPDNWFFIESGEREREYAMEWTEIDPVPFGQNVMKIKNLSKIQARSQERIAENASFQKIVENARRLENQRDQSRFPLSISGYQQMNREQKEEAAQYEGIFSEVVNQGARNLAADLPAIQADESWTARNEEWLKNISKDLYLKEAMHILHDLIVLN
jgi:carboxyl-terminal processing protease